MTTMTIEEVSAAVDGFEEEFNSIRNRRDKRGLRNLGSDVRNFVISMTTELSPADPLVLRLGRLMNDCVRTSVFGS